MSNEIVWSPPEEIVKSSKLTKFLKFCKLSDYDELEKKVMMILVGFGTMLLNFLI